MIIGNKSDLDDQRVIEYAVANSKVSDLGLNYREVSAKTGDNIKQFFKELACIITGGKKNRELPTKISKTIDPVPQQEVKSQQNEQKVDLSRSN